MSLFPTKTRLSLLEAVRRGEVKHMRRWVSTKPDYDVWEEAGTRVTAAMRLLVGEGWARLGRAEHASMYAPQVYELTPAGERILREHGGG